MQFFRKWIWLILLAGFSSCEKVIELDIREADMKYVIEGVVTGDPNTCKVKITRTKRLTESNQFPGVSGAIVTITDNSTIYNLTETSPGLYVNNQLVGVTGRTYELSITINNELFTASCTMQQAVPIDIVNIDRGPFGQYKFATVFYTDPAGQNNGYRFIQYVNGLKDPAIFWNNDEFTDGQTEAVRLDNGVSDENDPRSISTGDIVTIELLSIDDPIYRFWSTMQFGGADGSGFTASPANPITNIRGGALGYFSVHPVRKMTVIAP